MPYIALGSTPAEEPCAQVGDFDYYTKAREECQRYIDLLRATFGPEPEGAHLRIKSFPHDFGSYLEVVCNYDESLPDSIDYAFRLDEEAPATWS